MAKLVPMVLLVGGLVATVLRFATSDLGLALAPKVTPTEEKRLVQWVRSGESVGNNAQRLHISEREVNLVAATAFGHLPVDGKAGVTLRKGEVEVDLPLVAPLRVPFSRWPSSSHKLRSFACPSIR